MINVGALTELGEALRTSLLREAYVHLPSGVVAVCGEDESGQTGMVASSFTWVSFDPPLVGFFVDRRSETWTRLRACAPLGVSVLSGEQSDIARRVSSRTLDRFQGVEVDRSPGGAPLLVGATATFECRLFTETDAGDHQLVLLEVLEIDADRRAEPLIYHLSGFRRLIAGA